MKNKKLLALLLLVGLGLTGCNKTGPSSSSETVDSGEQTSENVSEGGDSQEVVVDHQDPFVSEVAQDALLRTYNEQFDLMVDDFSSQTLIGTLIGTENQNLLRVMVDSDHDVYPCSADASIYKTAAPLFTSSHPDVIGFRMRKVGNGTLSNKDLILGLRGDDNVNLYEINLADAFDPDMEEVAELTTEWQDIEIDLGNSIEDDTTEYLLPDGSKSGIKVLETMVGFHLYASNSSEVSQVIEISEVYMVKGTTKTSIDVFDHPNTNSNPTFAPWWCDSTGFIVRKGVNINNGSYTVELPDEYAEYQYLVLEANGDSKGLKVNDVATDLGAVNGAFYDFVVETSLTKTLVLSSTTDLNISKIFLTNLKDKEALKEYPLIDIENRVIFDNFNRTQLSFTGDWDTASNADYSPDGISVALSYSNPDLISVSDGTLKIAQPAEGGYVNLKEANGTAVHSGLRYLVIVAKGNMEGFRLASAASNAMWSHDWLAGPGLSSIPTDLDSYPYQKDGFVHYIIDLKEMNSDIGNDDFIDMYFNNAVEIDSIYFADTVGVQTETIPLNANPDLSNYAHGGYIYIGDAYRIDITIKGTGDLSSLRFTCDNGEFWFKDSKVIGLDGNPISKELTFDEENPLTISIDISATNFGTIDADLHTGGFEGSTGTITEMSYTRYYISEWSRIDNVELANPNSAKLEVYSYIGAYNQKDNMAKVLELSLVADEAGATIASLRIEGSITPAVNAGQVYDTDGNALDMNQEISTDSENPTVLKIDLVKTFEGETSYNAAGFLHIHFADGVTNSANITFAAKAYVPYTYSALLAAY
ncbi:MAG: hypothetical protein ACI31G_03445 [Bacilli bacterium]